MERSAKKECVSHTYILKKTITGNWSLFLCPFSLWATPKTYPEHEFRWQSPCDACNQWPQGEKKIPNAVSTLKVSETALKVWMKLQAAANRCLEDIFLLFLKFFVLILSYPRWHLKETPSWLNYQERCGRSQESKTQKLSPTLKTLHLPDSSSCFLPPPFCVYNVPFPNSCEQFFLTWTFLDFSILPLSHRYCQSLQEPHALPGLNPHLPRSLHLPERWLHQCPYWCSLAFTIKYCLTMDF